MATKFISSLVLCAFCPIKDNSPDVFTCVDPVRCSRPACLSRKRRGAFNSKQLFYLEKYRPKMRLRFKDSNGHRNTCCIQ